MLPKKPCSSSVDNNKCPCTWCTKNHQVSWKIQKWLKLLEFINNVIEDAKYLPCTFNGDVIFFFASHRKGSSWCLLQDNGWYGQDLWYTCWSRTNTTNIQNEFGLAFRRTSCSAISNALIILVRTCHKMGGVRNNTEWISRICDGYKATKVV